MLKKACPSSSIEQKPSKGNRRQIFGFVEGHISHRKFKGTIF